MKYIKSLDVNESINEGVSSDVKKMMKAVKQGKTVYGENIRFPGRFKVLGFTLGGSMAEVDYEDGKGSMEMAAMNIDPRKIKIEESADLNEAKKFKPGDMWSNDFDYDGMMKYALKVNHKTPLKTLQKLHDSATDVNYHTPFSGLGNAIDWITDDGVNSQEGKDFMKQFHNDIKDEIKNMK